MSWKEPAWDDTPMVVPRRILQECEQALCDTRGLIQRLESHEGACCTLDARDKRALSWGRRALESVRGILTGVGGVDRTPRNDLDTSQ